MMSQGEITALDVLNIWYENEDALEDAHKELKKLENEIERLTEIKDLAIKDCMAEAAENERLRAVVDAVVEACEKQRTDAHYRGGLYNDIQQALADLDKD
jgi:hypothetical protein